MKTEQIISKLKEKGYVFPTCLQWTAEDIDLRLRSLGLQEHLITMNQTDKIMLLDDFFIEIEDIITEFINKELEEYLESFTHYTPSKEIF